MLIIKTPEKFMLLNLNMLICAGNYWAISFLCILLPL